jgi:hypothetical protein
MRAASSRGVKPVFFVDRSLGKHVVPGALRAAGARVEVHDDHFPQNALKVSRSGAVALLSPGA